MKTKQKPGTSTSATVFQSLQFYLISVWYHLKVFLSFLQLGRNIILALWRKTELSLGHVEH